MADLAQVVAAVAAGALLSMATMLVVRLYGPRRTDDREHMINAAADAVVEGVETFRQQVRAALPETTESDTSTGGDAAREIRSKAHLRMLVDGESTVASPHPSEACERSRPGRPTRRRTARETRP